MTEPALWQRLSGVAIALIAFGWLARRYRPLPGLWRGDASASIRPPNPVLITVHRRSYLTYLWVITGPLAGTGFGLIGLASGLDAVAHLGGVLWLSTIPSTIVHTIVNELNRPNFLVPPPYRHLPGHAAERAILRERRRAGLPPTDHLVEINDVRPYDPTDYEPYLVAMCSDCDWFDFPKIRYDSTRPDEYAAAEADLRRIAGKHTTRVAPGLQRPLV